MYTFVFKNKLFSNVSTIFVIIFFQFSIANVVQELSYNNNYRLKAKNFNFFKYKKTKTNKLKNLILTIKNKPQNEQNKTMTATYIKNHEIIARHINTNNFIENFVADAKGSVLKIRINNIIKENYNYDSYGNKIVTSTSSNKIPNYVNSPENSFQYNGQKYDNNTGLQFLSSRFYNPGIKRFINKDSLNLLNKFAYVNDNPVIFIDPTGHMFEKFNLFNSSKPGVYLDGVPSLRYKKAHEVDEVLRFSQSEDYSREEINHLEELSRQEIFTSERIKCYMLKNKEVEIENPSATIETNLEDRNKLLQEYFGKLLSIHSLEFYILRADIVMRLLDEFTGIYAEYKHETSKIVSELLPQKSFQCPMYESDSSSDIDDYQNGSSPGESGNESIGPATESSGSDTIFSDAQRYGVRFNRYDSVREYDSSEKPNKIGKAQSRLIRNKIE